MDAQLEQARTHFIEGVEHFEAGRLEKARQAFETSLRFAPGRPSVLGNLGVTLFHLGQLADAVPVLRQVTAVDPAYVDAWNCLGLSHAGLGQWADAVEVLQQANALSPQNAELLVQRGKCLLQLGRAQEAMEAYDRAVAVDPRHAEAWSARGNLLRELHRLDEAAACFEKALAVGADPELTNYYLASVKAAGTPPPPPRRYVESLFDEYAADFQSHLVGALRYQGYEVLLRPLVEAKRRYGYALELGCGTGLCGPLLHPIVEVLDGIDISQAMLDEARKLGLYRALIHADIGPHLQTVSESVDLVIAADVFVYVGDLAEIFRAVSRMMSRGGCFAFTVETPTNAEDLQLLPSLRYAHSERYVRRLAEATGFRVDRIFDAPIRYDQARPINGLYVYLAPA